MAIYNSLQQVAALFLHLDAFLLPQCLQTLCMAISNSPQQVAALFLHLDAFLLPQFLQTLCMAISNSPQQVAALLLHLDALLRLGAFLQIQSLLLSPVGFINSQDQGL